MNRLEFVLKQGLKVLQRRLVRFDGISLVT